MWPLWNRLLLKMVLMVSAGSSRGHYVSGYVARDRNTLDGAADALGAHVLVGAVAAAGEEEAPRGGPGLEVLGLHQAMEPLHS